MTTTTPIENIIPEGMNKEEFVDEILFSMGNMHSHVDIEPYKGGFALVRTYEIDDESLSDYGVPAEQGLGWKRTLEEMHDELIKEEGPYCLKKMAERNRPQKLGPVSPKL